MDNNATFKIDSKGAQRDLEALAGALDRAAGAATRMDRQFAAAANSADRNLKTASKSMERYAQIATLLSKIRFSGDPAGQIVKFGDALDKLGRARAVKQETIKGFVDLIDVAARAQRLSFNAAFGNSIRDVASAMDSLGRARPLRQGTIETFVRLIEVVARAQRLRIDPAFAGSIKNIGGAMDSIGRIRAIRPQTLKSFVDFIEIAARSQRLTFNPATAQSLREFGRAMTNINPPGKAAIDRLERMFVVLAGARRIPNAAAIARDLDIVAASAGRASAALGNLPSRLRMAGGDGANRTLRATAASADATGRSFRRMASEADKAAGQTYTLGERLRGLNHRFSLTYQFGTLFTSMFSAFTFGSFVRGIYDANIELAKLDKAMMFATRTIEGGQRATDEFIGTAFQMGLQLDVAAEAYGRFAISSAAAGLSARTSKDVFDSIAQTLQVVGASAQQQEYAFYGLTQMIQKGKVSSEEFNRQIGEQIPGNAAAGAAAMGELLGRTVEIAEFFDMMRKGQIMSADFVPAYARQLRNMFGAMQGLVEARPDIAVSRLRTAFTIFQMEIGKNNFMQELGQQLNRLARLFGDVEDGVFRLNPRAKELAKTLGEGLARAVRFVGDALAWAFENFDKITMAAKAIAVVTLTTTFAGWGKAALEATANLTKMLVTMRAVKAEAAATGAAQATGAAGALAGATTGDIIADRNRRGFTPRQVGGAATTAEAFASVGIRQDANGRREFGRRMPRAAMAADAAAAGQGITNVGAAATQSATRVTALTGVVRGLGMAFGIAGVALTALIGLMAVFSDKQTELGGKTVTFGDILAGAFGNVGDGIGKFFSDAISAFTGVSVKQDDFQKSAGRMALSVIASVVSIGKMFLTVFTSIGKLIGTIISNTILPFIAGWEKLTRGDIVGAGQVFGSEMIQGNIGRLGDLAEQIGADFAGANPFAVYDDMERRAQAAAARRESADGSTDAAQRAREEAEAAMRQQDAARMQAEAAARQIDAARRMQEAMTPPSWTDLRGRIDALASGDFAARARTAPRGPTSGGDGPTAAGAATPTMTTAGVSLNGGLQATASQWLNMNESRDRNEIASFLRENAGVNIDPAITAWCAAFVNAVLGANGLSGTNSNMARSFMTYGQGVEQQNAQAGDIVVLRRGNDPRFGHVGLFQGYDDRGNVRVLGGNQGGASQQGGGVTVASFARSDVLAIRRADPAAGGAGSAAATASADDAEAAYNQGMNDYKSVQGFIARSDPASQAIAQLASRLEGLRDVIERDETRVSQGYGSVFSPTMRDEVYSAFDRQFEEVLEAVNPFQRMVKETNQGNDLMAMQLSGGTESGYAWRQALVGLEQQGYDLEDLQDEAMWRERLTLLIGEEAAARVQSLADAQVEFEGARLRTKNLEAEIDLLRTRNELRVQDIAETGSRRDAIFAGLVNSSSDVGSYDDKLMGLTAEQRAAFTANAAAQDAAMAVSAARAIDAELSELLTTNHLNRAEREFRNSYKSALEQLTGLSGRTLTDLEQNATAAQRAMAENYAATIERFENPPGFQAWIDGLEPFERRLQKIKFDFVESLSEGITDSLMGDEVDWKGMFKDLRRDWMKAQVDQQLAGVMSWLGIGQEEAATPEAQALVNAGGGLQTAAMDLTNAAHAITQAASAQGSAATSAIGAISSAATGGMQADAFDEWMSAGGSASGIPEPTSADDFSGLEAASRARQNAITASLNSTPAGIFAANDNAAPAGAAGASWMSRVFGKGNDGQSNSPLSWVGSLFGRGNSTEERGGGLMGALALGGTIYDWIKKGREQEPERQWSIGDVNGLINQPGAVTTTGTEIGAKRNIIADIATMAMSAYTGGFGQGGGLSVGKTFGNMGSSMSASNAKIGSWLGGFFEEGGYANAPVKAAAFHPSIWANAPHYAEGTPNTSGGMPAILHPDEAVIPLSRGRKIPVEMNGSSGGNTTVNSNVTIVANDPNEFRSSRAAIARNQARTLKRAATRNLNPL